MGSEAAKKILEKRRKKLFDKMKSQVKPRNPVGDILVVNGRVRPKRVPKPFFTGKHEKVNAAKTTKTMTTKTMKAKKMPTAKGTAAAKKAWETRRANAEDPVKAEAERQEALRILDELAKNRPPVTEE